jgi:hypothetical protein
MGRTAHLRRQRRKTRAFGRFEPLEDRRLLVAGYVQNVIQPMDVNNDSLVTPMDALVCINELNDAIIDPASKQKLFMDVTGDGLLSTVDIVRIINRLNTRETATADGWQSYDGGGNNVLNADWGQSQAPMLRMTHVGYEDGKVIPGGADLASAREISNLIFAQLDEQPNGRGLSDMVWQWGQFLDHDIDLTESATPAEPFAISVPVGDPFFDPTGTGTESIGLDRSKYALHDGDEADVVRQQANSISAFINGSQVYGSDAQRAAALRTFENGRMKTSEGNLLPFNTDGLENVGGPSAALFLAGDVRANEQVGLTSMHTLFMREHNRIAYAIAASDSELDDETIYQQAREKVIAILQSITYSEFLPALLGSADLPVYDGYNDTIHPGISNVFATAAYRFGHSMLSQELLRVGNDGSPIPAGPLPLREAFFAPDELVEHGIEPLLHGLTLQQAQEVDAKLIDDVRNFLFGPPGAGGFDLASLNIQRGRDHGLSGYNQTRQDLGLAPVSDFSEITSSPDVEAALRSAYDNVDQIDAWVGGLAEDHLPGSSVGELVATVLVDQFDRLRKGDRFWYRRVFSGDELTEINETTLADVIERNTEIGSLPANVFFV